ncbi:hypothetical protein [Aeromonas hydrophila]|uniref:hypothetical protein n=1 Tax=Aeromonas hydrophila TaxID=644 RepID=UPI001F615627|nr:hypothetical protein [Aeromonas hydrophila]UNU28190.1 hypothetical protein GCK65_03070 [Aeromonas hydrophila]
MSDTIASFFIGILTGWISNFLWSKWQNRRKDSHLIIESDQSGIRFTGRFNAKMTSQDEMSKEIFKVVSGASKSDV